MVYMNTLADLFQKVEECFCWPISPSSSTRRFCLLAILCTPGWCLSYCQHQHTSRSCKWYSCQASLCNFKFWQWLPISSTVITLLNPPISVNVIPIPLDGKKSLAFQHRAQGTIRSILHKHSIATNSQNNPVIALVPGLFSTSLKPQEYTIPGFSMSYGPSRVTMKNTFCFDLAFAMTVHKAQGWTLSRVVLALSAGPNAVSGQTLWWYTTYLLW